jgi:hypothetical protein
MISKKLAKRPVNEHVDATNSGGGTYFYWINVA